MLISEKAYRNYESSELGSRVGPSPVANWKKRDVLARIDQVCLHIQLDLFHESNLTSPGDFWILD